MAIDSKLDKPAFAQRICSRLDELGHLQPNWDSYGAPAIDQKILAAARRFIHSLPENLVSPPLVVPMSPGNLQFEWHHGSKILELEFEDAHTIRYLQWHPEQQIEHEDVFDAAEVDKAVELITIVCKPAFAECGRGLHPLR
jgi:hypothetical protein